MREDIIARGVKRRFDDVKNLLGVIVLHKESGLPLYSRILRGGVDENIIAAFITAIRNFRLEFDIGNGTDENKIIPISDIIRVITTENLVVAFITLDSPSREQRERMVTFTRKIGMVFDPSYLTAPQQVLDDDTRYSIDTLFDEALDGYFQRNFLITDGGEFDEASECIIAEMEKLPRPAFKLDRLAREMVSCGIDEAHAYKTILELLNDRILQPTELETISDEDQFVADVETLLKAEKKTGSRDK
jgi:hypothetical protein